jgi:E1A/CREB-binding protein
MLLAEKDNLTHLTQIPRITNALVLDLHDLYASQPQQCTYRKFVQWLVRLYGDAWPKDNPPTVKAITLSVRRLLARKDKLKKLRSSIEKDQRISEFMDESYALPAIFQVKQEIHKCSTVDSTSSGDAYLLSYDSSSELEFLKSVCNGDLSQQLTRLKIESESLRGNDNSIKVLREKMYFLHRNTKKKLGRRDKAISEQTDRIDKQKSDLDKLYKKVSQMESQVQQLKKDKDRLRHRVVYWWTKSHFLKSSSEESEIQEIIENQQQISTLKVDLRNLEEDNIELRNQLEEVTSSTENEIETFHKGRFNDDIRSCCYQLLSLNVGVRNVGPVIHTVLTSLAHKSVSRLPSHSALCRMITEGLSIAEMQLGEKLTEEGNDNFTLQTDGTTKYWQHYSTFDIATEDGTYTLGLRHVFSGSAQDTLDTLKEILEDLDVVQEKVGGVKVSNTIVAKLKNTMSDCHAAEKLFNVLLADYRTEILPHVVYGWSEASDTEKGILTRMNNFFCGLHFIVGLAECAEATLKLWEETHELAATGKSSGTQRLVRTACKSFHTRGSQQAGCSTQFRTYLRSRGIEKIPLAAFRGNRFNILFYDAAGIYFLKQHMFLYLTTSHGSLNQLLQAVLLDLQVPNTLQVRFCGIM